MEIIMKILEHVLESLKNSPATLVLFCIVLGQGWFMRELIKGQIEDSARQSKMLTLLEVLVGRMK